MKGWRAGSIDISMMAPMRKPSRIPFFTQGSARQPLFVAASGSAARICPLLRASLNSRNSWKCCSVKCSGGSSKRRSTCDDSMRFLEETQRGEDGANARLIFRFGRYERKTPDWFEQTHFREGRL